MPLQGRKQRGTDVRVRPRPPQAVERVTSLAAPVRAAGFGFNSLTPADVLQLQRTIGNQAVIQRLPYAKAYTAGNTKDLLNKSEGRASPFNNAVGHPRQHVGRWEKAEKFAEQQSKTKSVYKNTAEQDKAIRSALASAPGQAELAKLDAAPVQATRVAIKDVATDAAEVLVVQAKKKKDTGNVKSWNYKSGIAEKATVIVDSMGSGNDGDIHIQTAFPVLD